VNVAHPPKTEFDLAQSSAGTGHLPAAYSIASLGAGEERLRDVEAERLGDVEVDRQLECGRLLD
jgi:hypothetical protein